MAKGADKPKKEAKKPKKVENKKNKPVPPHKARESK